MFEGVLEQFGIGLQLQEFHHSVLVRRHGSAGDFQLVSYFFLERPSASS